MKFSFGSLICRSVKYIKLNLLKRTHVFFLTAYILFASCQKDGLPEAEKLKPCELQTDNPDGRSYRSNAVVAYSGTAKHCGIIPLSTKNYWVYLDSIFIEGVFVKVQYDSLRFTNTWKSLSDELIWWQSNISVGLPEILYANDSTLFQLSNKLYIPEMMHAKKEFGLFPGDSIKYLASFEDAAAIARLLKVDQFTTPAGRFTDCIYFEKNAPNYQKDRLYFKPGVGVLKYIQEKAPLGTGTLKLQQVSTLVAYHIE